MVIEGRMGKFIEKLNSALIENDNYIDFRVILAAKARGDWKTVNEASLARAYQHCKNGHFGIITNHRYDNSPETNRSGFYELKQTLLDHGYGGTVLLGHWRECRDPNIPYDECPEDQLADVSEPSLFVPNVDAKLLHELGMKYNQDAVIYAGPETDGNVVTLHRDGSIKSLGKFNPNKIAKAYSELLPLPRKSPVKGRLQRNQRTFVFEHRAQSFMESLIESQFNAMVPE